jgi:hypothetical protein
VSDVWRIWDLAERRELVASTFEEAQQIRLDLLKAGAEPIMVRIVHGKRDVTPGERRLRGRPPVPDREPRSVNSGSLRLRERTVVWLNAIAEHRGQDRGSFISDRLDALAAGADGRLRRVRDDLRAALRDLPSTLHLPPDDPLYRLVVAAQQTTMAIDEVTASTDLLVKT